LESFGGEKKNFTLETTEPSVQGRGKRAGMFGEDGGDERVKASATQGDQAASLPKAAETR